jgi:predicted DNA-binding transcriptional regulator AlpA
MNLMTVQEAAAYCRLSKFTLERYRVTGEGPRFAKFGSSKTGGAIRYRQSDLDDWISGRIVRSTSEASAAA